MPVVVLKDDGHLVGVGDDMVVGDNVAARIDDKAGTECQNPFRSVAELERLFEKTMQELIKRRATLSKGRGVFSSIPLVLSRRLLLQLDRNIGDGRDDAVDEWGKARQINADLPLGFLSEITTGVVTVLSLRLSGKAKRREQQNGAGGACQGPAGVSGDHQSESLSASFFAKPAARLAPPRFERQSRDADTKFQGGQRRRRPFHGCRSWSISSRDWRSASPATPEGRLFAQHRVGQRPLDAGGPAVAIGKSRE